MAMTPDEILAEMVKVYGLNSGRVQAWIEGLQVHLSAQAKVRVTDEDVASALSAYNTSRNYEGNVIGAAMRAALESFAARLPQGARGEAQPFIWFATDDNGSYGIGADRNSAISDLPFTARRVFPLYTHHAERAAVQDGWVLVPSEPTPKMLGAMRKASINRHSDMYKAALTAAPQPPEGARVGDMRDVLGYFSADPAEGEFSRHETLEAARQAAEGLLDSAGDEAADWGWADDPPQICYGVVLGGCEVESREPAPEGSDFAELVNYRVVGPGKEGAND